MAVVPNRAPASPVARWVLRGLGLVLLLAGLYLVVTGISQFNSGMNDPAVDSGPGSVMRIGGGGFLCIFGLAALNAGFLGAQARYAADETSGAVRTVGTAWRGDGPTTSERVCGGCGAANKTTARFCDACGHALG